jgi:hypothetical protein
MKNFILITLLSLGLTGCSFLPRFTFEKPGLTPQTVVKGNKTIKCQGEIKYNENGDVAYCSKGFVSVENNFSQSDRKYTLKEKIINFIRGLAGWGFIIFLVLLFVCPAAIGTILGWILNGIFGVGKSLLKTRETLTATVRGLQKAKNNGVSLSPEEKVKYDAALKDVISTIAKEHADNPEMIKLVDEIRTDLKINEGL